jgi:6-pyruvoyltetrahydropterin/6-carboxytetrahydropterin synthase
MAHSVTRRLEFDAGHRVWGHEGKCNHIHGHRYVVEITVETRRLDDLGRVVDFGEVKRRVGEWVDANWDHNLLLNSADPYVEAGLHTYAESRQPFVFTNKNPTAEVIAEYLFSVTESILAEFTVKRVRVYETPNCWADYPSL